MDEWVNLRSKDCLRIFDGIAKTSTAVWPDDLEHASLRIAQRLSVSLHRASSHAIMKRISETAVGEENLIFDGEEDNLSGLW